MLIAGTCLNATSEYQTFVDEVNDALLRVSATESTVLMGDFNAHVCTDTDTWNGVIGKHGVVAARSIACHCIIRNCLFYDVTVIHSPCICFCVLLFSLLKTAL